MKLAKKIFNYYLKSISKTCKRFYTILEFSEKEGKGVRVDRRCKGCPYEYINSEDEYGCYIMKNFRKLNANTPAYWFNKR